MINDKLGQTSSFHVWDEGEISEFGPHFRLHT